MMMVVILTAFDDVLATAFRAVDTGASQFFR